MCQRCLEDRTGGSWWLMGPFLAVGLGDAMGGLPGWFGDVPYALGLPLWMALIAVMLRYGLGLLPDSWVLFWLK